MLVQRQLQFWLSPLDADAPTAPMARDRCATRARLSSQSPRAEWRDDQRPDKAVSLRTQFSRARRRRRLHQAGNPSELRLLQGGLVLLGTVATATGASVIAVGTRAIPGATPMSASAESVLRFYAAWWLSTGTTSLGSRSRSPRAKTRPPAPRFRWWQPATADAPDCRQPADDGSAFGPRRRRRCGYARSTHAVRCSR